MTGPATIDQVDIRYIYSQTVEYSGFDMFYLLSVGCKILLMILFINGRNFVFMAWNRWLGYIATK